ncbi:GAF domain-containing sensor histidine kinase [Myxacorys almedinensis]|uniref:histidine kinase n=1 Tax=Myxacorys almedinensis A TaxID=2690445 RepID=A0A8J7Z1R6_9CYAN|nr:GAF domain-containing sensor histidine kinase [Myxacorys almedinensis]NDJ18762.1 sensor histidine kinase [Myxacorys almedinensis A]
MPTSSEFIALCRAQVALLTQALGASLSIVYLTEEWVESAQTRLVPIAAYPDISIAIEQVNRLAPSSARSQVADLPSEFEFKDTTFGSPSRSNALAQQQQIILPLVHEEMVLGLLVTERDDRPWTTWERGQIQRVADTLSLACVMDQKAQWLENTHRQQRLVQTQQHDVLDNLVHQLRSPLTALRTFGKLLAKRLQPDDGNQQIANSIVRESNRLQELLQQVDGAIDISSADVLSDYESSSEPSEQPIPLLPAGVLTGSNLELESCGVVEILQPLLESATAIAQDKDVAIRTEIPDFVAPVLGNNGALREVLSNLIDNALKYTPSGGQVHVKVEQTLGWVNVWISDTGYGIPQTDLPHMFERHYRGVQAQGTIPGTGLGLAIARRLMEQMQGKIEVFSPLKNGGWISQDTDQPPSEQGTTFVVGLPVMKST